MRTTLKEGIIQDALAARRRDFRGQMQVIEIRNRESVVLSDALNKAPFKLDLRIKDEFPNICRKNVVIMAKIYATNAGELVLADFTEGKQANRVIGEPQNLVLGVENMQEIQRINNLQNDLQNFPNLGRRNENPNRKAVAPRQAPPQPMFNPAAQNIIPPQEPLPQLDEMMLNLDRNGNRIQNVPKMRGIIIEKSPEFKHKISEEKFFKVTFCGVQGDFEVTFWRQPNSTLYHSLKINQEYEIKRCTENAPSVYDRTAHSYSFNPKIGSCKLICMTDFLNHEQGMFVGEAERAAGLVARANNKQKIAEILDAPMHSRVTLAAKLTMDGGVKEVKSEKGEWKLRALTLKDETGEVFIKLWNDDCENLPVAVGEVYLFQEFRVSQFQGTKELAPTKSSKVIPFAHNTQGYDQLRALQGEEQIADAQPLVQTQANEAHVSRQGQVLQLQLHQINAEFENYKSSELRQYLRIQFRTRLIFDGSNFFYRSCTTENCKKAVSQERDGTYRCHKCHENILRSEVRCRVKMNVPNTNLPSLTMFNEELFKEVFNYEFGQFVLQYETGNGIAQPALFEGLAKAAGRYWYKVDINFKKVYGIDTKINAFLEGIQKLEEAQEPIPSATAPVQLQPFDRGNVFSIPNTAPQPQERVSFAQRQTAFQRPELPSRAVRKPVPIYGRRNQLEDIEDEWADDFNPENEYEDFEPQDPEPPFEEDYEEDHQDYQEEY